MTNTLALEPPSWLLIFDCDGVLVDSEALENQLLIDMAALHGVQVDPAAAHQQFIGRKLADCVKAMENESGRRLPKSFIADYRNELRFVAEKELKPVAGIHTALAEIALLKCVASNGPREKIELALRVTDLSSFFGDRIFSAYDVNAWKPDPALFLHAAGSLGVAPENSVVVEDSRLGVQAAIAAGMPVIEYAPGGGTFGGNKIIRQMDQLPLAISMLCRA